jgi:hypothetical protein
MTVRRDVGKLTEVGVAMRFVVKTATLDIFQQFEVSGKRFGITRQKSSTKLTRSATVHKIPLHPE